MNEVTTSSTSWTENNQLLRNIGPLKIWLFHYYVVVLWIYNIDAICTALWNNRMAYQNEEVSTQLRYWWLVPKDLSGTHSFGTLWHLDLSGKSFVFFPGLHINSTFLLQRNWHQKIRKNRTFFILDRNEAVAYARALHKS